jgi:cobalt/nickel transport system permease protein
MHIPDGMLEARTWIPCLAAGAGATTWASAWVRRHLDPSRTVLMAVLAALIFALQMLNFPVAAGTSGHFSGGALAGILMGPWPACLVLSAVLVVQALLFGDGGLTALGANILNMAVIAPFLGWTVYRLATRLPGHAFQVLGAFLAAWTSVLAASLAAALEIALSGRAHLLELGAAMAFWHALIGVGEGLITASLVAWLSRVRPALLQPEGSGEATSVAVVLGLLALAAAGASFLASASPDGLEYVYFEKGLGQVFPAWTALESPFPDYHVPGLPGPRLAGVAAGFLGLVVSGVMLYGLTLALRRRAQV